MQIQAGAKRLLDQGDTSHQTLVKSRLYFTTKPQDYDLKPPDIFVVCSRRLHSGTLPQKFQDFARIFKPSWDAYESDFQRIEHDDFELTRWEGSRIVEALNFNVHVAFLSQIMIRLNNLQESESASDSPIWELVTEYIQYTFNRLDISEDFGDKSALDLLIASVPLIIPQVFRAILKYSPETLPEVELCRIWTSMIYTATSNKIDISLSKGEAVRWFELFHALNLRYGVIEGLSVFVPFGDANAFILNSLLQHQPLFAALAQHDPEALSFYFRSRAVRNHIDTHGIGQVLFWLDRILELDQDFKFPKAETDEDLCFSADSLFESILTETEEDFSEIISYCIKTNFLFLLQFLLMYSSKARASIPTKTAQWAILVKLVEVDLFNFDFIYFVIIISGFGLSLSDFNEYFLPQVEEKHRNNIVVQGLRVLMEILESAPTEFTAETIWTPPTTLSPIAVDTKGPFIFDVGRILLARHFRIAPSFTKLDLILFEESCYRDLAWFMTYFINLYHPDLTFTIRIEARE